MAAHKADRVSNGKGSQKDRRSWDSAVAGGAQGALDQLMVTLFLAERITTKNEAAAGGLGGILLYSSCPSYMLSGSLY